LLRVGRDQSGATAVAFGLIAPVLLLILAGIVDFGIALNNNLEPTDAVRVGARQFAVAGQTTMPQTTTPMRSATTALQPGRGEE
jgi:Flp pilus assembly protein TadG